MGKINLANIEQGLQKVKTQAEGLENTPKAENVPAHLIAFASDNPYAEDDTDESLYDLAMSIQANGLLHPLTVNRKADGEYTLISGERRFKAIQKHLHWRIIPCTVYRNLSQNSAQLKLHIANLEVREYTAGQKLQRFQELEALLLRMKESGEYTGAIQKGLAGLLGVSSRQVRKYKAIAENAPEELKQQVIQGEISINEANTLLSGRQETRKAELSSAFRGAFLPKADDRQEPEKEELSSAFRGVILPEAANRQKDEKAELGSAFRGAFLPKADDRQEPEKAEPGSAFGETPLPEAPVQLTCRYEGKNWGCVVTRIKDYGSHYEITVESRSGFTFLVGKSRDGAFLCAPSFGIGCSLAEYTDTFWNQENISRYMGTVDAATIACTLKKLAELGRIH